MVPTPDGTAWLPYHQREWKESMRDEECIEFLQWAVPQLHMRWAGFRKVRGQVCKRLSRRLSALGILSAMDYRQYLLTRPHEWETLDRLCRVTISRFYRDKFVFNFLLQEVLPTLAQQAIARGDDRLKVWSAGCGSGEEPYSIAIVWREQIQSSFPQLRLELLATDADPHLCKRARKACYQYGSVKNLPVNLREKAFIKNAELYCLKPEYQHDVQFLVQDIRQELPVENFDLVLCRNLVFTYFNEELQNKVLARMQQVFHPDGVLVIGIHEHLPVGVPGFRVWSDRFRIYRKIQH